MQTAYPGTYIDAEPVQVDALEVHAGVLHRHFTDAYGILDEPIDPAQLFGVDVGSGVEVLYLGRYMGIERCAITD